MYSFKEQQLGNLWCSKKISEIKKFINTSQSFTVVGVPGTGVSMFLRYLATRDDLAHFVHIDLSESAHLNTESLLSFCRSEVAKLLSANNRVVVILNRFDIKKREFDHDFLVALRSIRDLDKEKVVFILTGDKPLIEEKPDALLGGNLNMYSISYQLTPFEQKDLLALAKINLDLSQYDKNHIDGCLRLSGGHYQLFALLLKTQFKENYLKDPFIKAQLKQIYMNFSYQNRKLLQKGKLATFSPLFSDYIKDEAPMKLAVKENQLFRLFRKNLTKVVTKDQIFESLWPDGTGSDWALNALIYRLRKNPAFIQKGYIIENYKKQGYCLQKN